MTEYCLGIDIGTSNVKVGILNLSTFGLEFNSSETYDSSPEQESGEIWEKTLKALKSSVYMLKNKEPIVAFGLSGQMHGTVLLNDAKVIDPIINWQDGRCNLPLRKYNGMTTVDIIQKILGQVGFKDLGIDKISSGFFGATLFYLKENNKTLFSKIKHAVLPTDFIRGKLLGGIDYATDQTNAFSTGLFNVRLNKWHKDYIAKLGLPYSIFPDVHYTSEIAGYICKDIRGELDLEKEVPVIYGGGDNQVSIIGNGLSSPESPVCLNIGTGAQVSKIIQDYRKIDGIDTRSFFNGMYILTGASLGGGSSYNWLKDEIIKTAGIDISFSSMDKYAASVAPLADGLKFCTGPSRVNPERKKGFYGNIKHRADIGHVSRAVMEGVLSELFKFYRLFGGDKNNFITGSGNGMVKSKVWPQITADMFGKEVRISDTENAVLGASLMAAEGVKKINNFKDIFSSVNYRIVLPNKENTRKYQKSIMDY